MRGGGGSVEKKRVQERDDLHVVANQAAQQLFRVRDHPVEVQNSWCLYLLTAERQQLLCFFQAEDGIRDYKVTGVQTCALPIYRPLREEILRHPRQEGAAHRLTAE